jgi:exopolysaccharide biosynthesis polyprenyl glycosylphosphotransferase
MISDRRKGIQNLVLTCQCILVTGAFWLWFPFCYTLLIDRATINRYLIYNLFLLLGLVVGFRPFRSSLGMHTPGFEETSRRSLRQFAATLFYLLLYVVAARDVDISRFFFFSFMPLLYVILFASNRFLPGVLGRLTFRKEMVQKVILMGPKRKALELGNWLHENEHLGLHVEGLLTDDKEEVEDPALPVLGRPEDLGRTLAIPGITKLILVEFPRGNGSIRHYVEICEALAIRLLVVADLDKIFGHPVAVFEDQGMFFLGLREEPLESPVNRFLKRCLDIVASLPVVVFILPPLMLVVWIAQRLQSPGPLFFPQAREGFHNEPFSILKYRTMHVEAEPDDRLPSSKDDPRLYPFGSFLRRTSLDEMPQFWNVLCGKMSVVGPRPHLKIYNDQYRKVFHRAYVRSLVKPGVTGLAQARGFRGDAKTPEEVVHRMESDIEYLENWSLWLDCWLILRTALQIVAPPKGAV